MTPRSARAEVFENTCLSGTPSATALTVAGPIFAPSDGLAAERTSFFETTGLCLESNFGAGQRRKSRRTCDRSDGGHGTHGRRVARLER